MKIAFKVFLFFVSIMVTLLGFGLRFIALMDFSTEDDDPCDKRTKGYGYNEAGDITYNGYPFDD